MYNLEKCVACRSKRICELYKDIPDRHYYIHGKYTLYKCGLVFLNSMPTASELDKCYGETYYSYVNFMKKNPKKGGYLLMNYRKIHQLLKKLNSINFFNLRGFKCGNALCTVVFHSDLVDLKKKCYFDLINVPLLSDQYTIKNEGGSVLFVFTNSYGEREDYKQWFIPLSEQLSKKIVMMSARNKMVKLFTLKEKLLMLIWLIQMIGVRCHLKEKLLYCNYMLCGVRNIQFVKKVLEVNKVKSIVTLCDVHVADYFITEYCNKIHLTTITLQHGYFCESTFLDQVSYRFSLSQYFLTYNQYTKKIALDLGLPERKLVSLGMPHFIGQLKPETRRLECIENKFLVVLDCSTLNINHEINMAMLDISNHYAQSKNMQFDVKVHPGTNNSDLRDYRRVIDKKRGFFLDDKMSKEELFSRYVFGIFHETTMIFEAIFFLLPTMCYRGNGIIYKGIELLYFSTYSELIELKENTTKDEKLWKTIRRRLCGKGDIARNYAEFLNDLS